MKKGMKYILLGISILLMLGMTGCGVSHKSPEGVVKALIQSYVDGKESKVKECYGVKKDTDKDIQTEIDATIKYFKAHNVSKLKIDECDILSENKKYAYTYITYNLVLENEQEYPCVGTYMVGKEDGKYYVLPPSKITEDMSKQAATDFAKFMTTDTYKNYTKAYETFIKKNPGYEEKIAGKVS